jgi:hypothetical protein
MEVLRHEDVSNDDELERHAESFEFVQESAIAVGIV